MDFHKNCKAKFDNMKQQGRLQLLIIILPDFKGSYGECFLGPNLILRLCSSC